MVAIGQGASKRIESQITSMGRNLMMVLPGALSSGGFSMGSGSVTTLTPEDGIAIKKEIPAVESMTPVVRARGLQLVSGSINWAPSQIMGCSPAFVEVRDWPAEEGAFFTDADVISAAKVCVLGKTVADQLFQGDSPIDQVIRVKNMPFKVVGVLARKGTSAMGQDQDDLMVCPGRR
jgi:ABC-type antimicrobial peptide transport system permease subunit